MSAHKQATIYINPPPGDGRCECCGKHIKELKPFGKAGDPLVGDFDGQILLKNFRTMYPRDNSYEELIKLIDDWDKLHEGNPKLADNLSFYEQLTGTVEASWECRDCFILEDEEHFKLKRSRAMIETGDVTKEDLE